MQTFQTLNNKPDMNEIACKYQHFNQYNLGYYAELNVHIYYWV